MIKKSISILFTFCILTFSVIVPTYAETNNINNADVTISEVTEEWIDTDKEYDIQVLLVNDYSVICFHNKKNNYWNYVYYNDVEAKYHSIEYIGDRFISHDVFANKNSEKNNNKKLLLVILIIFIGIGSCTLCVSIKYLHNRRKQ